MASIFEKTPINKDYNSPTPGAITLMAGYPNSGSSLVDDSLCKQIKDCGFNALSAIISTQYVSDSISNCKNNGLVLFLNNATLRQCKNTQGYVNQFKGREGLGGWFLNTLITDSNILNPDNVALNPNDSNYCPFYKNYNQIYEADGVKPIFLGINADGDLDVDKTKPSADFPTILAKFQEYFQPSFWTWAYFPSLIRTNVSNESLDRWATFYKNLQYFAYVAQYTAVPFWTFCRCQSFNNTYDFNAPTPTTALIRQIVFSSLAYGAQGIYYWNYRLTAGSYNVNSAPINSQGVKTGIWYNVQTINEEVKAFNDIFCDCDLVDCRHVNNNSAFANLKKLYDYSIGPLIKIEGVGTTTEVLVSHINNKGVDYLVIVSTSIVNTVAKNIKLTFSSYWNVYEISYDGTQLKQASVGTSLAKTLKRGDYLIFTWK